MGAVPSAPVVKCRLWRTFCLLLWTCLAGCTNTTQTRTTWICFDHTNLYQSDPKLARYFVNGDFVGTGNNGTDNCCRYLKSSQANVVYLVFPVDRHQLDESGPPWAFPFSTAGGNDNNKLIDTVVELHAKLFIDHWFRYQRSRAQKMCERKIGRAGNPHNDRFVRASLIVRPAALRWESHGSAVGFVSFDVQQLLNRR